MAERIIMTILYNILGLGIVGVGSWYFFDRPIAFLAVLICLCTEIVVFYQHKIIRMLKNAEAPENSTDSE